MSLFAAAEEGAGWAIVATLASLILAFLTTQRRDRRKADNDAVLQWKELASTAIIARDAACKSLQDAHIEILNLRVLNQKLESELFASKGKP
jgi:hypothetical protein